MKGMIFNGIGYNNFDLHPENWQDIRDIVARGIGKRAFPVGTQIEDDWTATNGTKYTAPWDVMHFPANREMILKWHYAFPDGVAFDAPEAIAYAETELPAGTYHIPITAGYGTGWVAGQSIQFTLSKAVPAGGQIYVDCATNNATNPTAGRTLTTYAVKGSTTVLETTTTSNGTDGTLLGAANNTGKPNGIINAIQRVVYGYGRWAQSAMRQYLNSTGLKNQWWLPQNPWDRPPSQHSSLNGFLSGFSADFLSVLQEVDVVTAINTVEGSPVDRETTRDKIWLPSLEEMYITPQLSGVEGVPWDYYKELAQEAGLSGKFAQYGTYPELITKSVSTASAVYVWLRSAYRGNASHAWIVYPSGYVNDSNACYAHRGAPACKIKA